MFVDEDGNEVVFVDEEGNVITDPSLIDDEFEFEDEFEGDVVIEAGKPASARARGGAADASSVEGAARAAGSHLKKAGGMFAAFKEEYDKASRE